MPEAGCWIWLGAQKGNGYGNVRVSGRNTTAHRRAYELAIGPVPEGLDVCHKCDTRLCINPDHLFLGTRKQNMDDAAIKGRLSKGARHSVTVSGESGSQAKLTWPQVEKIRARLAGGERPKSIAQDFPVTADNIRKIKQGKTWRTYG